MSAASSSWQAVDAPLDEAERGALRDLVHTHGEVAICSEFHLSRQTIRGGIAGLKLQRGSVALVRQGLAIRQAKDTGDAR